MVACCIGGGAGKVGIEQGHVLRLSGNLWGRTLLTIHPPATVPEYPLLFTFLGKSMGLDSPK
jgi:hypothetical protein